MMNGLIRSRWAAIGAAVAVTLGGGGVGLVAADIGSGERSVFVSIAPCRIADTRPARQVGPRNTPLGANEVHTISAHGTNGNCTIPSDAVGLSLNVTAVGATLPTFLTIWETGIVRPTASSLNPVPGQPPTPNAVTTRLSSGGQFDIYNLQGTVHVLVDVNGYHANHHHDDRYYTESEVDTRIANNPGPEGPKGDQGDRGFSAWDVIPSGTTVTGNAGFSTAATAASQIHETVVPLPGVAPVPLTNTDIVYASADPTCTGTASNPTAPAGKVCLYDYGSSNGTKVAAASQQLPDRAFWIGMQTSGAGMTLLFLTWAYTAP